MLPILQSGIMMYIYIISGYIWPICQLVVDFWFVSAVWNFEILPSNELLLVWISQRTQTMKQHRWFWMMPLANLRICQDMDRICQNFASPFGQLESQFGFERHVSALHVFGGKGGLFPVYDVSTCSSFAYRMLWGLQMFSLKWRSPQNFEKLAWLNCLDITACILIIQMSHT